MSQEKIKSARLEIWQLYIFHKTKKAIGILFASVDTNNLEDQQFHILTSSSSSTKQMPKGAVSNFKNFRH